MENVLEALQSRIRLLEERVLYLESENKRFLHLNSSLCLKNRDLLDTVSRVMKENEDLQGKISVLEDKLHINSSNSGLPTSKEVYTIETLSKEGKR